MEFAHVSGPILAQSQTCHLQFTRNLCWFSLALWICEDGRIQLMKDISGCHLMPCSDGSYLLEPSVQPSPAFEMEHTLQQMAWPCAKSLTACIVTVYQLYFMPFPNPETTNTIRSARLCGQVTSLLLFQFRLSIEVFQGKLAAFHVTW